MRALLKVTVGNECDRNDGTEIPLRPVDSNQCPPPSSPPELQSMRHLVYSAAEIMYRPGRRCQFINYRDGRLWSQNTNSGAAVSDPT